MIARSLLLALTALAAWPAAAEVRIVERAGTPELDVRLTPEGPWSPLRVPVRDGVLNPHGDRLGDGLPSADHVGDALVVAWMRQGSELHVVRSSTRSTASRWSIAVDGAPSQPTVVGVGDFGLVLWNQRGMLHAVAVGEEASPALPLQPGRLLGTVPTPDGLRVVSLDGTSLVISTVVFSAPIPVPIPIEFQRVLLVRPMVAPTETLQAPCVGATESELVVVQRLGRRDVVRVVVTADEVIGPEEALGSAGSCRSLLEAAR